MKYIFDFINHIVDAENALVMVKVPPSLLERSRMNSIKESSMIEEFRLIEMNSFMIEFFSLKDPLKMVELTNSSLWKSSKIKKFEHCINLE
jgi:hypothetical protein